MFVITLLQSQGLQQGCIRAAYAAHRPCRAHRHLPFVCFAPRARKPGSHFALCRLTGSSLVYHIENSGPMPQLDYALSFQIGTSPELTVVHRTDRQPISAITLTESAAL